MPAAHREQRSLFGEILDWMLAPLLLLWPMSLGLTWLVAQAIASRPYDRELADLARALARTAAVQATAANPSAAEVRLALERAAQTLKRTDDDDRTYYQILGRRGELLAGEAGLAVPGQEPASEAGVRFRDDMIGDEPVRVAYVWLVGTGASAGTEALVQVAETLGKRSQLATEIIKGVILPQFVILPLAVVLVWFALARGIRPLAELQQRIRARESTDLSAIAEGDVPDEVVPLVRAINDLLQRLDRTIATQRHFLADAAHQLKTPLAGLRMQAEIAAREIDSGRGDTASIKHSLRQIALSTQRAAHMVNQLLAMARAEDTDQASRHQPVDLTAVTRAVVRDFVPRAIERRIDLGYEGPDANESTRLIGEPVLLSEMVRNLVDNALQYTPKGGTVTARVVPDPFGQVVVLQVEDTGPGIAASEREAVFRPFYRGLDTQVDGSGLGLAIVLEVAQRHGAEVTVVDARPRSATATPGALFTVRFPLTAPKPQAAATTAA
ncbi:sensor histidine kinase [Brevundimonas sp.]|uniref:sensor histidine kinase n=1 Tax=Brevundimonas sp. TaxID=1871086 RepID=UPI0027304C0C|nr:sensor histidine kinase N-terminal domain-containing protein [Brevundimonas sp.]MDP1912279.1 sensor histidine kinase N-terminal domain-containing protein [Brevundimonas sp.]